MPEKHQPERLNIIAGLRGFAPDAHLDSELSDGISSVLDENDICFARSTFRPL